MKHYKAYTAKKLKFPRRLMFFVIIAVIIFIVTVIVGNILKSRLEKADIDTSEIPEAVTTASGSPNDDGMGSVSSHDTALLKVVAGCLNFTGCTDAQSVRSAVDEVRAAGFNAVSFVVTDPQGRLTYASPAVQNASRLTANASLISFENLKTAVTYATSLKMRVCAVMTKSDSSSDVLVAQELSEIGANELLICGFESYQALDNGAVTAINTYIAALRAVAPLDFGVCLSSDVYTAAQNSPYIEKLYANTEFLAVDMTKYDVTSSSALAESIKGSFQAYLLRPVLVGSDVEARTKIYQALAAESVVAASYISAPERVVDTTAADTSAA